MSEPMHKHRLIPLWEDPGLGALLELHQGLLRMLPHSEEGTHIEELRAGAELVIRAIQRFPAPAPPRSHPRPVRQMLTPGLYILAYTMAQTVAHAGGGMQVDGFEGRDKQETRQPAFRLRFRTSPELAWMQELRALYRDPEALGPKPSYDVAIFWHAIAVWADVLDEIYWMGMPDESGNPGMIGFTDALRTRVLSMRLANGLREQELMGQIERSQVDPLQGIMLFLGSQHLLAAAQLLLRGDPFADHNFMPCLMQLQSCGECWRNWKQLHPLSSLVTRAMGVALLYWRSRFASLHEVDLAAIDPEGLPH